MKKVLAVVAHADDEVLGMGGTLARHVHDGDRVEVCIVCENSSLKHDGKVDWEDQAFSAGKALGDLYPRLLRYPDQSLDRQPFLSVTGAIAKSFAFKPDVVYTHWSGDLNRDHRVVNEAVQLLTRPMNGQKMEVLEAFTLSSTEYSCPLSFVPDTWVDIGWSIGHKLKALSCYKSELQTPPHPRNVDGVLYASRYFGQQIGAHAAEVFKTMRRVR